MTREEQIKQASIEYTYKDRPMCIGGGSFSEVVDELNRNYAFEEGAKWADGWWINKLRNTNISLSGRLHNIWKMMHQRCTNPKRKEYKYYGQRGISVCEEWENFISFAIWSLLNDYNDSLTIDRIDNNGNYEPLNCRWVNKKIQANNTSRNHFVCGKTIANHASDANMNYRTLHNRITRSGMNIENAITALPYNTKKVYQYSLNGDFISEYPSARIASQKLGGKGRNHIDDVCRGKRKTAFGYKWSYNKIQ
jgi:hypothetical protein